MLEIFEIGTDGYWTGASRDIAETEGAPAGWTRAPLPALAEGEHAQWTGQGWIPTAEAPDHLAERKGSLHAAVNVERDRRTRSPFGFGGHTFDYDAESQKRITGAAALAGFALTLGGKLPGDLLWHGGDTPFTWIAADNSLVQLDAPSTFALGQAAATWESAHVFAARALKDAIAAAPDDAALDAIDITAGWPE